jgi:hypothetical protein
VRREGVGEDTEHRTHGPARGHTAQQCSHTIRDMHKGPQNAHAARGHGSRGVKKCPNNAESERQGVRATMGLCCTARGPCSGVHAAGSMQPGTRARSRSAPRPTNARPPGPADGRSRQRLERDEDLQWEDDREEGEDQTTRATWNMHTTVAAEMATGRTAATAAGRPAVDSMATAKARTVAMVAATKNSACHAKAQSVRSATVRRVRPDVRQASRQTSHWQAGQACGFDLQVPAARSSW